MDKFKSELEYVFNEIYLLDILCDYYNVGLSNVINFDFTETTNCNTVYIHGCPQCNERYVNFKNIYNNIDTLELIDYDFDDTCAIVFTFYIQDKSMFKKSYQFDASSKFSFGIVDETNINKIKILILQSMELYFINILVEHTKQYNDIKLLL